MKKKLSKTIKLKLKLLVILIFLSSVIIFLMDFLPNDKMWSIVLKIILGLADLIVALYILFTCRGWEDSISDKEEENKDKK